MEVGIMRHRETGRELMMCLCLEGTRIQVEQIVTLQNMDGMVFVLLLMNSLDTSAYLK